MEVFESTRLKCWETMLWLLLVCFSLSDSEKSSNNNSLPSSKLYFQMSVPCSSAFPVQVKGNRTMSPRWAFSCLKITGKLAVFPFWYSPQSAAKLFPTEQDIQIITGNAVSAKLQFHKNRYLFQSSWTTVLGVDPLRLAGVVVYVEDLAVRVACLLSASWQRWGSQRG